MSLYKTEQDSAQNFLQARSMEGPGVKGASRPLAAIEDERLRMPGGEYFRTVEVEGLHWQSKETKCLQVGGRIYC